MRNYLYILFFFSLFSCQIKNLGQHSFLNFDAGYPLEVPEENSLMFQWNKKAVGNSLLIDDMEKDSSWEISGIGVKSYTNDRYKDGKRSLRFHTSIRDTADYRLAKNRSEWDSYVGGSRRNSSIIKHFESPQDWSAYNRISFWVYVHKTSIPVYTINIGIQNEGTVSNSTTPQYTHFVHDLKPGKWNLILFEIPHLKRDKVTLFRITQVPIGHHPEEEGYVTYDFDQLELQSVEADQFEGWEVAPGKFAFSHVGYRPGDLKIALAGSAGSDQFQLIDQKSNVVYSGKVVGVSNKNGQFYQLDFTDFHEKGIYRIRLDSLVSNPFPINEDIWFQTIFKTMNFYFCERCGYQVPGIHLECHQDWQGFYGKEKKIINGGWHDAGDLSQGYYRTAMAVYTMMQNLEVTQGRDDLDELTKRIRSELEWGLKWLLKSRFGEGYHMSWSKMKIYSDNKVGTVDDVVSPAQNVPWENFLASAVLCKASVLLKETDKELSKQASIAAIEDWQAAMASRQVWDQASYQEAAWGISSSLLLFKITNDFSYKEHAIRFGELLMRCQEKHFPDEIPITGYFYTNTSRTKILHNYHAAFEEAPLIALAMLCKEFPEHKTWMDWYSSIIFHSEFFLKRGSLNAAPYNHLPASVYKKSEVMAEKQRSSDKLRQYNDGTPLNDEYALRTFPVWPDNLFHGNTNIQMSSAWALAEASRLRGDSAGMRLVGKQLEWIFGANPFGQSLMYGVGYDFAPHFAYCLKNIVGSLPVGMDCMSGDKPYWHASNYATFKEIWIEPVNKFLGTLSIYSSYYQNVSSKSASNDSLDIQVKTIQQVKGSVLVKVTLKGLDKQEIKIKAFNAISEIEHKQIDLTDPDSNEFRFNIKVSDQSMPYILLISSDKSPGSGKEVIGFYDASIK